VRRFLIPILSAVALAVALPVWSISLDDARRLHEEGRTAEALAAIESVLGSDAAASDKAIALDLLGTIAVDEGQLAMARQAWLRLTEEYPDYAASHDTATKLRLVSALLKAEGPAAPAPAPQPVAPAEPVTSVPPSTEPAAPQAPATPEPTPAPSPEPMARDAAPVAATAAPQSTGRVLVAAKGKPHDAVRTLSDRVVAHLRERGVNAESATGGIPVVEDSKMVLPLLLQRGQTENAESVLLLAADFVSMQKVALDCYSPGGAKLWKVKVSGGTGWKGRPYSKTGITEELAQRFIEKLDGKIGGPGLPVTLQ
jgi:hypothetical protein